MGTKKRDRWDKADIILKPVGGFLAALSIASLGFFGSRALERQKSIEIKHLERQKSKEVNFRLYSEIMSKREEAESSLRKDRFKSIIDSFLRPGPQLPSVEEKVLNLELLAYNFHECLNLKPIFAHIKKQITAYKNADKQYYLRRLEKVAKEIKKKQLLVLEGAGEKFERGIDLEELREKPEGAQLTPDEILKLGNIKRRFRIYALKDNPITKEIKLRLEIKTPKQHEKAGAKLSAENEDVELGDVELKDAEFWVGFYDFPMIDNTRLSHDQRCAIVLTEFAESSANIAVVYFPGSHASLKEKPYYQDVIQNLLNTEDLFIESEKK